MGKLLPSFKKAIIEEIVDNISTNTAQYYVYASNPVAYSGNTPALTEDDFTNYHINNWNMLFGKKLANVDIVPVIEKNMWSSNSVYRRYDDTFVYQYSSNTKFYVVTTPDSTGGDYKIYKCIDNANGAVSTTKPNLVQATTFETADGYKWRYMYSITNSNWIKFNTDDHVPVYVNTAISAGAQTYAGIEVVVIANGGVGYSAYHNGNVVAVVNSTVIQIENNASLVNDFYTRNSIYIYNTSSATGQLLGVSRYISNTSGNWVYLDGVANTTNIEPNETNYRIAPKVVFSTDGDTEPMAYCVVNSTTNSIGSVIILEKGSNIRRANVEIQSNTVYGSGANLYAIVPPPGGHGHDPASELDIIGLGISFNFTGSQGNNIVTSNAIYNKVGLIRNPYSLTANNTKGSQFYTNVFSQVLRANVSPPATFTVENQVVGANSGAIGTVVFSNTTQVYLVGDKHFIDGEPITSANGLVTTNISINTLGDLYVKDLKPIYVQNINNINRAEEQTELFKLVIQI